ncbi:MAG: amidohydrolase family protein [Promethearchaeota archaeon]
MSQNISNFDKEHNRVSITPPEVFVKQYGSVFDFHAHLEPNLPIDSFMKERNKFSIEGICIMPSWKKLGQFNFAEKYPNDFLEPDNYLKNLDMMIKELEQTEGGTGWRGDIYKFIPIDFKKDAGHLEEIIENVNPAGVKIHPLQDFPIDRRFLEPYFKVVQEHDLLLYIHTDWVPTTEWHKVKNLLPETFERIAKWFPDFTIIMGHAGNNDSYVNVWKILKKYKNVVIETSLSPAPQEIEKVKKHIKDGYKRILFGSNFPFSSTGVELTKIFKMNYFTHEEKEAILRVNAKNLLKDRAYIKIG